MKQLQVGVTYKSWSLLSWKLFVEITHYYYESKTTRTSLTLTTQKSDRFQSERIKLIFIPCMKLLNNSKNGFRFGKRPSSPFLRTFKTESMIHFALFFMFVQEPEKTCSKSTFRWQNIIRIENRKKVLFRFFRKSMKEYFTQQMVLISFETKFGISKLHGLNYCLSRGYQILNIKAWIKSLWFKKLQSIPNFIVSGVKNIISNWWINRLFPNFFR